MSRPVLFLDIDGVLNGHEYDPLAESCMIRPACVERLNRVLAETGASLCISSAWRYMILGEAMTLAGFSYLLRTHGVRCSGKVIGHLGHDKQVEDPEERGRLIFEWLARHPNVHRYAVVDDMAGGFAGLPIVRTDGRVGLVDADVEKLVALLGRAS